MENGKKTAFQSSLGMSSSELKDLGLTKREYFTVTLMQGLCSGRTEHEQPGADAKYAVQLADILLKELED